MVFSFLCLSHSKLGFVGDLRPLQSSIHIKVCLVFFVCFFLPGPRRHQLISILLLSCGNTSQIAQARRCLHFSDGWQTRSLCQDFSSRTQFSHPCCTTKLIFEKIKVLFLFSLNRKGTKIRRVPQEPFVLC